MKHSSATVRRVAMGGAMGALIFAATFFIRIPISWGNGHVNMGDGVIFLAADILGTATGLSASVGSCLADLVSGYAIYTVPTFAIKGLMGLISGKFMPHSGIFKRTAIMTLCELIMVCGYCAFERAMYGATAAFASVPMNLAQGVAGILSGLALGYGKRMYKI